MFEQYLNMSCWPQSPLCLMYSRMIQLRTVGQRETSVCLHTSVFWGRNVLNVDLCYKIPLRSRHLECEVFWCSSFVCHSELLCWCVWLVKGMGKKKIIPWDHRFLLNSFTPSWSSGQIRIAGTCRHGKNWHLSYVPKAVLELFQHSPLPALPGTVPSSPCFQVPFAPFL